MPRQWYRKLFVDHPGYAHGDPAAFFGSGRIRDKVKVWCEQCYYARAADLDSEALLQLWSDRRAGWIACRPDACLSHLRRCNLQPQDIRDRAVRVHALGLGRRRVKDASRREMRRATTSSLRDRATSVGTEEPQSPATDKSEHASARAGVVYNTATASPVAADSVENPIAGTIIGTQQFLSLESVLLPENYSPFQTDLPTTLYDPHMVLMTSDEPKSSLQAPVMLFSGQDGFDDDFIMRETLFPEDVSDDPWWSWPPEHYLSWQCDANASR